MICNNCKSEWKTDKAIAASLSSCPFCGESLLCEDENEPRNIDNSMDALVFIAQKHGNDVLLGKQLKVFFSDYAPQVSRNIKDLVFAVQEKGAAAILKNNLDAEQEEKEISFKRAVAKLTDAFIAQEAAENIIYEFTLALGWKINTLDKKTDAGNTTEKKEAFREPGKAALPVDAELYRKASEGDAGSQNMLGWMYYSGEGVAQDYWEAMKWYRRAADQGKANAQCSLGHMYFYGQGVSLDYQEALKWYQKAADQGLATAQNSLGVMYRRGYGVAQDFEEAIKWFQKAINKGNELSKYNLGAMYYRGEGVAQDYKEAFRYYFMAADHGYSKAEFSLGYLYENGEGVAQDYQEAMKWYRKAADQGHATAQNNIGDMYYYGIVVAQDYQVAVKWYRKAADQGNKYSQFRLGRIYIKGEGVAQDYLEAIKWYRLAAEQGHATAQEKLSQLLGSTQDSVVKLAHTFAAIADTKETK